MNQLYRSHGVSFEFPEDWELSEETRDDQILINLAGPGTAFWSLVLMPDCPQADRVADTAVEAFRQEYNECDVYPAKSRLCDRDTISRDIEFVCLELINTAFVRAFETDAYTGLVLCQATDEDLPQVRRTFERISKSLTCVEDLDDIWPSV